MVAFTILSLTTIGVTGNSSGEYTLPAGVTGFNLSLVGMSQWLSKTGTFTFKIEFQDPDTLKWNILVSIGSIPIGKLAKNLKLPSLGIRQQKLDGIKIRAVVTSTTNITLSISGSVV